MKRLACVAVVVGAFASAGPAMAQAIDLNLGVGFQLAPGQTGQSPGRLFNSARALDPTVLSPGQQLVQDKAGITGPANSLAPGHGFENHGRSKK